MTLPPIFFIIFFTLPIAGIAIFVAVFFYLFRYMLAVGKQFTTNNEFRRTKLQEFKADAEQYFSSNPVSGDLVSNIANISSNVQMSYVSTRVKEVKLKFYSVQDEQRPIPLVVAKGFVIVNISNIPDLYSYKGFNGAFFAKSESDSLVATILNGEVTVEYNSKFLCRISMQEKMIYNTSDQIIGHYERKDVYIRAMANKGTIEYPCYFGDKIAGSIHFDIYSEKSTQLLNSMEDDLEDSKKIILFSLGILEFLLSIK